MASGARSPATLQPRQGLLTLLARDADSWVRFEAAGNPSTPPGALIVLAGDEDLSTRSHLAGNPSIPPAAVEALTAVPGNPVCEGLASNPASPVGILERLGGRDCLHDSHGKGCDCRFSGEAFDLVLAGVLGNPSTPERLAADIVADTVALWSDDTEACAGLAAVDADPESQQRWAQNSARLVRAGLARNRRLDATAAATLAADNDPHVLDRLLSNPACPAPIFDAPPKRRIRGSAGGGQPQLPRAHAGAAWRLLAASRSGPTLPPIRHARLRCWWRWRRTTPPPCAKRCCPTRAARTPRS